MKGFWFLFIWSIVVTTSCDQANPAQSEADLQSQKLSEVIDSIVASDTSGIPFSGTVTFQLDGDNPISRCYGYTDPLTLQDSINGDDYFMIASISKWFTGMALLQVMDEYQISHFDTIGRWFPELSLPFRQVTIQQLANHRNGIHDYFSLIPFEQQNGITNDEVIELLVPLDTLAMVPGSRYGYSNSGYVLMAEIVKRQTNQSFDDYLRSNILEPLELTDVMLRPQHTVHVDGVVDSVVNESFGETRGPSGLYFRAKDWEKYFSTENKLNQLYSKAEKIATPWFTDDWQYGFGWFFSTDTLGDFRAHSGLAEGFHSHLRCYKNIDLNLVIMMNQTKDKGVLHKPLRESIIQAVIDAQLEASHAAKN